MSPMVAHDVSVSSKFTRGEKCIFIHLVLTFLLILMSTITYFVHIYLVEHPGDSYLIKRRFSQQHYNAKEVAVPDYLPIGILFFNNTHLRTICNTIHLRESWSIAPAHCVIIRTDPDMAPWLSKWGIKYRTIDFKFIVTDIKRGIAHPHYNRDDFRNNIGLLEHTHPIPINQYISLSKSVLYKNNIMGPQENKLKIIEWIQLFPETEDIRESDFILHFVDALDWAQCSNYMAPVVDIRSYEYCITLPKGDSVNLYHGAALLQGNDVEGFFSWGERRGTTLPFIILHIADFKDWLHDTMPIAETSR